MSFRWTYIILPLALLVLSAVFTASFYPQLSSEVAYNFKAGAPDRLISREAAIAWGLAPQVLLVLLAVLIVGGAVKLSARFRQVETTAVKKLLPLMGNMVALPQIILCFALLDIFRYNAYQAHIMPLWLFAVLIMALGVVILGVFFILAIRQVCKLAGVSRSEN